MFEGYVIDWTITAAIFATSAAFVASGVTFFSSKSRHDLDARIEICKYREKWLEQLRLEIVGINNLCVKATLKPLNEEERDRYHNHTNMVTLLVSDSNSHWNDLKSSMMFMNLNLIEQYEDSEELGAELGRREAFITIAKRILKEEWDEIQSLLYKEKKKNAKNK